MCFRATLTLAMISAAVVVADQRLVNGPAGRLFVDDGGQSRATPVLFIHSLGGNANQWTAQLRHVRRTRRGVGFDLRGHGQSDPPPDHRYGLQDYAADVRSLLDDLHIARAIVVGHSMGGGIAVAFAGQSPDRVAGLLLVDPIDDPSKRPPSTEFDQFLAELDGPNYSNVIAGYWTQILEHSRAAVRQRVMNDLRATRKESIVFSMREMTSFNAADALRRYTGPMLTVTTPMNEYPSSLHNVIAGLRRETMTDVSHWLHLDRPSEFNAILDRFLTLADAAP